MKKTIFRYKWKSKWYYVDFSLNKSKQFKDYEARNKTTPLEQHVWVRDNNNFQLFEGDIVESIDWDEVAIVGNIHDTPELTP